MHGVFAQKAMIGSKCAEVRSMLQHCTVKDICGILLGRKRRRVRHRASECSQVGCRGMLCRLANSARVGMVCVFSMDMVFANGRNIRAR